MKNLSFVVLIMIFLGISNPERGAHINTLKNELFKDQTHSKDMVGAIGQGFARALGGNLLGLLLEGAEYRNYLCFSVLVIERKGDDSLLTMGVLGQVIVLFDRDKTSK
jgi:hypothetical protein